LDESNPNPNHQKRAPKTKKKVICDESFS